MSPSPESVRTTGCSSGIGHCAARMLRERGGAPRQPVRPFR
ncbi:hypothetical protein [Ectothiorhodospira magna]|nr:hypothetical protein [Ectothiorhodospira magna]